MARRVGRSLFAVEAFSVQPFRLGRRPHGGPTSDDGVRTAVSPWPGGRRAVGQSLLRGGLVLDVADRLFDSIRLHIFIYGRWSVVNGDSSTRQPVSRLCRILLVCGSYEMA